MTLSSTLSKKCCYKNSQTANFLKIICRTFFRCVWLGYQYKYLYFIGGSRGDAGTHPPSQWDRILSFSHTFPLKIARVRGQRLPPNVKSWIRNYLPFDVHNFAHLSTRLALTLNYTKSRACH